MIFALFSWNLALLAPSNILGVDASCMPYLFYVYILPITNLSALFFIAKLNVFLNKKIESRILLN